MRVPYRWLLEFIDLDPPLEEVAERLSLCALEVDEIHRPAAALDGVVVGRLLSVSKHPGADKLTLCQVAVGSDEPIQIVCGASNHREGNFVAVATVGTKLPGGLVIKKNKIRGEVSFGMLCSLGELGFPGEHGGILILDGDAELGSPVARAIGLEEAILDVDILPDRGDCASVLGVARELGALYDLPIREPESAVEESAPEASAELQVENRAQGRCHQYLVRLVRGVRVGPSPDWLVRRIEALGLRPINNVVDVTNLVLMELGQPLHAFDAATIPGKQIVVRMAAEGETIDLLDDQKATLCAEDLVIADVDRAIALAGVMGGVATAVSGTTMEVILEAANFEAGGIRRTVRKHGLRSDSSYRFERGVDPNGLRRALDRAARLLQKVAGGQVASGVVEANGVALSRPGVISLRPKRVEHLLGISFSQDEIAKRLTRVGVQVTSKSGVLRCAPPSWRLDLWGEADYVEEILRLDGYACLPETLPVGPVRVAGLPAPLRQRASLRESLRQHGFSEVVNLAFGSQKELELLRFSEEDAERAETVALANPLGEEMAVLRTTLFPALLCGAARNLRRGVRSLRHFEISKVFFDRGKGTLPEECVRLAAVLVPAQDPQFWKVQGAEAAGFFQAKQSIVAALGSQGRYTARVFAVDSAAPYYHPSMVGAIGVDEREVGAIGRLHPEVARSYELPLETVLFEVDLAKIAAVSGSVRRYREAPRYQAVVRDLALLVDSAVSSAAVEKEIRAAASKQLEELELFDQYEGEGVPAGRKSLAFRLTLRSRERTLQEKDVTKTIGRVLARLEREIGAEQR